MENKRCKKYKGVVIPECWPVVHSGDIKDCECLPLSKTDSKKLKAQQKQTDKYIARFYKLKNGGVE